MSTIPKAKLKDLTCDLHDHDALAKHDCGVSDDDLLNLDCDVQDELKSLSDIKENSHSDNETDEKRHPNSAKRHKELTLDVQDQQMDFDEITPNAPKKFEFSLNTINEEDSFVSKESLVDNMCQTS